MPDGTAKSTIRQVLFFSYFFFFLLTITRSGCVPEIRWSVCITKSWRTLCVSYSPGQIMGCAYTTYSYCQISISCTFPIHSYLVVYSFCANLIHSLIVYLIVSSLSLNSPHLHLFFALVQIVLNITIVVVVVVHYFLDIQMFKLLKKLLPENIYIQVKI